MEEALEKVLERKFYIAVRWIRLLQHGYTIPDYFAGHDVRSVIVYGITDFTSNILNEYRIAKKLGAIRAISDKKVTESKVFTYYGIPCIPPENLFKYADEDTVVIVTAMGWYREIRQALKQCGLRRIMTIEELIYDMCGELKNEGKKMN